MSWQSDTSSTSLKVLFIGANKTSLDFINSMIASCLQATVVLSNDDDSDLAIIKKENTIVTKKNNHHDFNSFDFNVVSIHDLNEALVATVCEQNTLPSFVLYYHHHKVSIDEKLRTCPSNKIVVQIEEFTQYVKSPGLLVRYASKTSSATKMSLTQHHDNVTEVWKDIQMPLIWRAAIYSGITPIMTELFNHQVSYIKSILNSLPSRATYIEVGCGTAEMARVLDTVPQCLHTIGVELNPVMLSLAKELHPSLLHSEKHQLICGDATELQELLKDVSTAEAPAVVCILMNTLGILPTDEIRKKVVNAMLAVAVKTNGVAMIVCWHASSFETGVTHLYQKHPELCGEFNTNTVIDIPNANLSVKSTGYTSHWFTPEEIMTYVNDLSQYEVETHVFGVGVFVTLKVVSK